MLKKIIVFTLCMIFVGYGQVKAAKTKVEDCPCGTITEVSRTEMMPVVNPKRQLQFMTIGGDTAYTALRGTIVLAHAETLWNDLGYLKDAGIKELHILVLSPGGIASAGFAYADFLEAAKSFGMKIITEASGIVASAAVPIFLSGTKRIAGRNTVFMLHPAKVQMLGYYEVKDLKAQQGMMALAIDSYKSFLREHTKLTEELIEKSMTETIWFNVKEAKEWGFVDEIR